MSSNANTTEIPSESPLTLLPTVRELSRICLCLTEVLVNGVAAITQRDQIQSTSRGRREIVQNLPRRTHRDSLRVLNHRLEVAEVAEDDQDEEDNG
ncbi:hypothetical protein FRC15_002049 [Serendipita sp. 397]|nr:hypothetical protein FRC15_002049 [Serendipita sp. 397]